MRIILFCLILLWAAPSWAFTLTIGWANTGDTQSGRMETSSPSATPMSGTGVYDPMPAIQTIATGDTIAADACGGLKRLTSAGAVSTNLTNTFTAPGTSNIGCKLQVCNVGTNNITLDNNANFKSIGAADIVLTADDCTVVESDGIVWRSIGSLVAN